MTNEKPLIEKRRISECFDDVEEVIHISDLIQAVEKLKEEYLKLGTRVFNNKSDQDVLDLIDKIFGNFHSQSVVSKKQKEKLHPISESKSSSADKESGVIHFARKEKRKASGSDNLGCGKWFNLGLRERIKFQCGSIYMGETKLCPECSKKGCGKELSNEEVNAREHGEIGNN